MEKGSIAGRYRLLKEIGRGGMAHVWEAFDEQLQRNVAVKRLTPERFGSPQMITRFGREATAIAQLDSPHVVRVFDYGIEDDQPYIVMELLEGEDLSSRLKTIGRMTLAAARSMVTQVCRALTVAHEAGIVHRDLKPANVFASRKGGDEVLKVLDFGVVSVLDDAGFETETTTAGTMVGTPRYMSPEQVRGAKLDERSDLWSLGVLIYRAVVGEAPFKAAGLGALVLEICIDPFPMPSTLDIGLPPALDEFFERALAKDPARRFQTAREMGSAFMAATNVEARGPAKILFVDDEPDVPLMVRQSFRRKIKKSIYEFVFAENGEAALESLREHPDVDMVVTDINMPVMDGLTLLSRVSELDIPARTVIVSAYGDMLNIRAAMNRGAFDFLVKPIDFSDLEKTIEKTLRHVETLKTSARTNAENDVLRTLVNPQVIERLSGEALHNQESWDGTVCVIAIPHDGGRDVVRTLNANFEVVVPILAGAGGVIDKFVGNSLLAVFRGPDHIGRALEACLCVREQISTLNLRAGEDSPFVHGVSIGVATGELIASTIGARASGRVDFAVLGDVVREATRLQGHAEPGTILAAAKAREGGARFCFRDREGDTTAYELVGREMVAESEGEMVTVSSTTMTINQHDDRTR